MDQIQQDTPIGREESLEKVRLLEQFTIALINSDNLSIALQVLSDEFDKFKSDVVDLVEHASEMSDFDLEKQATILEEKAVYILGRIEDYKHPPIVYLEKGQLFRLFQNTLQMLQNNGCIESYTIESTGDDFDFSIAGNTSTNSGTSSQSKRAEGNFSLLRQHVKAYRLVEKDLVAGKAMLSELSKNGFNRAKFSLAWAYAENYTSESELIEAYRMTIECINDGLFDAFIIFIMLNNRISDFGLSNKDTENILKMITLSMRTRLSTYAKKILSDLYLHGHVKDWEIDVRSDVDIDKAIFFADEILKSKIDTRARLFAIGVKIDEIVHSIQESDDISDSKKTTIDDLLTTAILETKSSKAFSEMFKNMSSVTKKYFYPLLEKIIIDENASTETKNKARYALAEQLERNDPSRTRELLLNAAYDGCPDSQDILFDYASGKKEEAHLLSIVAGMIADRQKTDEK